MNAAALQAEVDKRKPVSLSGTYTLTEPIRLPSGARIQGNGAIVKIEHDGPAFEPVDRSRRTHNWTFSDITLTGPAGPQSVGIDADQVTSLACDGVTVAGFGKAIRLRSEVNGWTTYARFHNVTCKQSDYGWAIEGPGSNGMVMEACRALLCTEVGVDIINSNDITALGCQFEGNATAVRVTATSIARADYNSLLACRFEGNTLAWDVTSTNVRGFQVINPHPFGPYRYRDAGSWTSHVGVPSQAPNVQHSAYASAAGSWRFERSAPGGDSLPALVVHDSAPASGAPTTLQLETERPGHFVRMLRRGAVFVDVSSADGSIRLAQGGCVEFTPVLGKVSAPPSGARLYARLDNDGRPQLVAQFPSGVVRVVAADGSR